jgi:hypothetical protein
MITSTQSGYAPKNRFAGLATTKDSDDDTANIIVETIHLHVANFSAQTMATINKHATQTNVSLQQLASNTSQLHQQQQAIMNQMAMMSLEGTYQGAAAAVTLQQVAHAPPQICQPPALPHYQKGYYNTPQQSGEHGCMAGGGGGCSHVGRG